MKGVIKKVGRGSTREQKQLYAHLRDKYADVASSPFDAFVSYLRRVE